MDDEPLSAWAKRRDAKIGRLRAVPLVPGEGHRGAHLAPDAPRAIQQWNGHIWEAHGIAADFAAAGRILYPEAAAPPAAVPARQPLRPGRGKHRKPPR
ncbi:hypothetical protein SAMN05428945_1120 [Streptomyces sp. 2224.1]|uniref:DUF6087 family protein n=1 Tax=unclassified Streptomyces TaxID=2593676 RepID=UPI000883C82F|nr:MULTISPECIES: DUF6087 family protein [unclassified Streptomyces]PBC84248.1 hypothetical protein BX261_4228 [Streptomyces sp. 2321.6]SDR33291.1 hypothetical protein SAMN05216511_2971 [Streptomyces sp. KS_16]SEB77217.1 hypothetical protein SAMN05428945_1120 [Streptomyces sp. 2224.1]SED24812.1 hypothetical protein SAMN05428940_4255 [Streptomyces sp. 2133.1]SEE57457.1 hypothetical protein SAMN05428954_3050 [Streptomyces sp. 2112.3]